jgi:lipopolysaccharide export system permease protein
MKTVHRYIALEILKPLSTALLAALIVLLIERMLRLMEVVLGANGPLEVVFQIMAYLVPQYLGLALPISLLLGVMLAFNKLGRDGELTAFQAAGISLTRLIQPALLIALFVTLVSLAINGYLRPYGRYAYQVMLNSVTSAAFQAFVRAGVFTQLGDRTFLIQRIGGDGSTFERVFVFEADDGKTVAVAARRGTFVRAEGDGPPILRLFDGVRMELKSEEAAKARADGLAALTVLTFGELRTGLGSQSALMLRERGADQRELTLAELWQGLAEPRHGIPREKIVAELHTRLVRSLTVPLLPFLGVALAAGRSRHDRVSGVFLGLLVLVGFGQVIDFTKNFVQDGLASPLVALWLPWGLFALLCFVLFRRLSEGVGSEISLRGVFPPRLGRDRHVNPHGNRVDAAT